MVYEILLKGKENAITGKEICNTLGIKSRELMAAVERERRAGKAICASTGGNPGYFIAANRDEMEGYCKALYRRAGNLFKTRRACLQTLEHLPQVIIPGNEPRGNINNSK